MVKRSMGETDSTVSPADPDGESLDGVFEVLASRERRFVLYTLVQSDRPAGLVELARRLAAWRRGAFPEEITPEECQETYLHLYHTHVPLLDEVGAVEYDQENGQVTLSEMSDRLTKYTTLAMDDENVSIDSGTL